MCQCILAIPFNRATRHTVEYLEHDEMQALLAMYDTGARVQEILDLRPMERFGSARRLASWAGVCPGNRESAGKRGSGRTRNGNRYLRRILCEIAHAASRTRNAQFGPLKKGLTARRGAGRAVVAVAHKILRISYAMLRDGAPYVDPEIDYSALVAKRNGPHWLRVLADTDLLEQALRHHFERYGPSPPVAAA